MNGWIGNIETFAKTRTVGVCPFCGSEDTDYCAKKVSGDYGYAILWCNKCRKSHIISSLKVTTDLKTDNLIPDDLI